MPVKNHKLIMPTWQITLVAIHNREMYKSEIAKEIDNTYSHIVNVCRTLKQKGLIKETKTGRKLIVTLTEKGKQKAIASKLLMEDSDTHKKIPFNPKKI